LKSLIWLFLVLGSIKAFSQEISADFMGPMLPAVTGTVAPAPDPGQSETKISNDTSEFKPWNLTEGQRNTFTIASGLAVPTLALLQGVVAWNWGQDGKKFGFKSEGWFDKSTYSGGADKTGHMFSHYIQKRFYSWLSAKLGHDKPTSQLHGLLAAGLTGLMIEVGDGFSRYQFCPQDLIADTLGITLAYFLDEYPKLDELIGLRWEYWPSQNWMNKENKNRIDFMSDHSGQKFYFSVKAKGVPLLADKWYTKYLTLDVGFYTRGFDTVNASPSRSQWFSYGAGINLGSLIQDFGPKNGAGEFVSGLTKYWIPPGTVYTGDNSISQAPGKF